jgi:hypothetical protein
MRTSPIPKPSQDDLFRKFNRMIWKFANMNKFIYGNDLEESYADHCLAFCEAYRRWRPEQSEFSTVLYHHLKNRAFRNTPIPGVMIPLNGTELPAPNGNPEHYAMLREGLRGMSLEGRILSSIALDPGKDYGPGVRGVRWAVRERAESMGVPTREINRAWKEVRQAATL